MKHLYRIAVLFLALALFTACAAAEESCQQFGLSVDWETTIEQMRNTEGVTDDEEPDTYSSGGFTQYGFTHQKEDETKEFCFYIFKLNQLVMYGVNFTMYRLPEGVDSRSLYDAQLAKLTGKYGDPTTGDKQRFIELYSALGEDGMEEEELDALAGWELEDGTELLLICSENEYVIFLVANRTRVLGGE